MNNTLFLPHYSYRGLHSLFQFDNLTACGLAALCLFALLTL